MSLQSGLFLVVYLVLLIVKMWALIDAILRPAQAYLAADKMTKTAWLWITGLALATHVFAVGVTVMLIGTVASFVYLLDVRPALAALTRRRRQR